MVFSAEWLGYLLIIFLFAPLLVTFFIKSERISRWLRYGLLEFSYYKKMLMVSLSSAIIARFVFVEIIRLFYYNPRPFLVLSGVAQLVNHETTSSFPSGHATFYFALAMGVFLYNKKIGHVYIALAGLISFARIFVGVHWPLDILAGAGLGSVISVIMYLAYKKMPRKAFLGQG